MFKIAILACATAALRLEADVSACPHYGTGDKHKAFKNFLHYAGNDKQVNVEEFKKFLNECEGMKGLTDAQLKNMMKEMADSNGDGIITEAEVKKDLRLP